MVKMERGAATPLEVPFQMVAVDMGGAEAQEVVVPERQ